MSSEPGGIYGDRHADRGDLHGVTVILAGRSGRTYLGRWHEATPRGVVMKNVAIHDPAAPGAKPREDWLADQRRFGVAATESVLLVPPDEAGEVARLV